MSLHAAITREVDEGPSGAQVAAFFDLDRTLVAGFSAIEFFRDGLGQGRIGPRELVATLLTAAQFQLREISFSAFVTGTSAMLRGIEEEEFRKVGERIFTQRVARTIYPESRALVLAHERKGHTVAIVSSATRYQIDPVARDLGIEHVLCTLLEVRDGRFTGNVVRPTCYGEGKADAARTFAEAHGIDLEKSFFYSDSDEDLPLLDIVGHPRPTNPNRALAEVAAKRGWPSRTFTSRGTPGPMAILRSALSVGSLFPSFLMGLPVAALNGSWQKAINLTAATWGELGTALAGIELRVRGEEHLWSQRPAVFIFNHQSAIETLLLCKLLRRDFVGISKQEVRRNPILGPMFSLAGTVFIDRFNHESALKQLEPAIEALRKGISLAIAPEGTRSPTPKLNRFKKGAFYLAMQAKVPIVPIVFRNTLDALPKDEYFLHPATIEVIVHPPIPTDDWTRETLADRIREIRDLYQRTLDEP